MISSQRLRRLLPVTALLVALVALAACGSSSGSSSDATTTTTTTAPSSTGSKTVVIKTVDDATLGKILVDADGKTVYTLTRDGTAVACADACLQVWPPVLLPSGTTEAAGAAGVTGLAVTSIAAGEQVTSKGLPLYTFAADTATGDAKGDGITSFGGTWHVVKVGAASSSATSSTTESSGGYKY